MRIRQSKQYPVAIAVVAAVVMFAWAVGRNRPVPLWITQWLIPILGWIYIAFAAWWIFNRVSGRMRSRR